MPASRKGVYDKFPPSPLKARSASRHSEFIEEWYWLTPSFDKLWMTAWKFVVHPRKAIIFTAMTHTADYWIEQLHLEPHPEGGYFRESYRSAGVIPASGLPNYFGSRNFSTAIYFLLKGGEFSALHKLKSDEIWHIYEGCSLNLHVLLPEGTLITKTLGKDFEKGEHLQLVIPANHWFAAQPVDEKSFTLAGCTLAPGFDFNDFELASCAQLSEQFPQHKEHIRQFTREKA